MKIYLATPIEKVNSYERISAELVAEKLRMDGHEVFCPWEMHMPHAWDYSNATWGAMVFSRDTAKIEECDWMVVISYGRKCSAGHIWEMGYAYGLDKKILVLEDEHVKVNSLMVLNGCTASLRMDRFLKYGYNFDTARRSAVGTEQK